LEPEDCLSTESLLKPSLMICKAANTWLDSGKELYVDELSRVKPQEASKLEESLLGLGGEAKGTFATPLMRV
jgi:hypothetical protein